jgi:S1-C subfamily serine protease
MKRALAFAILACCAFVGGTVSNSVSTRIVTPANAEPQTAAEVRRLGDQFEAVARRVSPAVVVVEATKPTAASSQANQRSRPLEESGSGILVRIEGQTGMFVLTNNHVVAQSLPQQITITVADGRLLKPTRVWSDPESDIAVLQVEQAEGLRPATLGDSETTRVGQWVLAFGSPFGLSQTVTHGIISARERGQVSLGATIRIKDFLQTDAAINPGSSGGPLVNLDGEVIGINTAIASHSGSNSGVAFSIPINLVKRVTRQLFDKGNVQRGSLGLQLAQSFEPADALRLGLDRANGALIELIFRETPAAAAGLRANDVVLQVDEVVIRNDTHLINTISSLPAGQKVKLRIWRDRKPMTVEVAVGEWSKVREKTGVAP